MKRENRTSLRVEELEARWVPATVKLLSGNLFISNPVGALVVTATANNQFSVQDNGATLGTFNAGSGVSITGRNAADSITFDVNGLSFTGNLFINSGNGNDTIDITNATGTGRIGGSVTVLSGLGDDSVAINAAAAAMTIGGSVQSTDAAGNDSFTFGNGAATTTVGGSLALSGMNNVQIDQGSNDSIGGDLNISLGTDGVLDLQQGLIGGSEVLTLGGSVNLGGGAGSDSVFLRGMVIGKNLNANLGGADNGFAVSSSAASVTVVIGNTTYTGGSGVDDADLASGVFHGNVTLNLGDGNDIVSLQAFSGPTIIDGNLTVNAGNGDISITNNTALIGGDAIFNLGNGNSTVSFDAGGLLGGKLRWHSGNGNNSLTLAGAQSYDVNVVFGSGDDAFTLNNAAAVLTGFLDGGGRLTANTFNQVAGTLASNLIIQNFP